MEGADRRTLVVYFLIGFITGLSRLVPERAVNPGSLALFLALGFIFGLRWAMSNPVSVQHQLSRPIYLGFGVAGYFVGAAAAFIIQGQFF